VGYRPVGAAEPEAVLGGLQGARPGPAMSLQLNVLGPLQDDMMAQAEGAW